MSLVHRKLCVSFIDQQQVGSHSRLCKQHEDLFPVLAKFTKWRLSQGGGGAAVFIQKMFPHLTQAHLQYLAVAHEVECDVQ